MVVIEEKDLIGEGRTRACYQHPDFPDKCIKVFHMQCREKRTHRKELKETRRLLRKKLSLLVVPDFHGTVETNLGTGFIFDYIKGESGEAPTLRNWIKAHPEGVNRLKTRLYDILLDSTAVFSNPHSDNLLVLDDGEELKFAIIDGLGEKPFIKVRSFIPYLARKRFKSQWPGLEKEIDSLAAA
jgi:hypothetical protein